MSRALDHPLSGAERMKFLFHHYWCFRCRRFHDQVHDLEHRLGELDRHVEVDPSSAGLPRESKQRVQAAIESARAAEDR